MQFRMDLEMIEAEVKEETEDGVIVQQAMRPDPERYERVDDGEQKGWFDTHDDVYISDDTMADMWEGRDEDIPLYYSPDSIDDWDGYISEKYSEIYSIFEQEGVILPAEPDHDLLEEYADEQQTIMPFVIMKVDLVGSTELSMRYNKTLYLRIIAAFEYLVVDLLRRHNGFFLKREGDGIYGFFPSPDTTGKHDNAALCALRIKTIISEVLGLALTENGYRDVDVSIGLDSGHPDIVPDGRESFDIMGVTMNLAGKMESAAQSNEIIMGEMTERNLHTTYRDSTREVTDSREWQFSEGDTRYSIYSLDSK
ncbi:adenylate/guanylate cyclase domain-containing protein [Halolamina pelagica]|uniref:adenylate/guanylate cyclase domain-containing protein n=1 Tax=Halolamina pelagica TaxID=699431 RepID=UPI00166F85C9|nr:adenylate/guanylate cyclase domain-containing protein [Halolamina pelagica]